MFTMVAIVGLKVNGGKTFAQLRGVPAHRPAGTSASAPEHALLQAAERTAASRTSHPSRTTTHCLVPSTWTIGTWLRDSSRAHYLLID